MKQWIVTYYDTIQDQTMWVEISADTSKQASAIFEKKYGTFMPIVRIQ